ncbi:MAG: DUF4390 domain-containing protein [Xanthomonadales bacterium]|nr:DUF4390 domain-containing protein [Xanthomonadales bacterium]
MQYWKNNPEALAGLLLACALLGACHAANDARPQLVLTAAHIERSAAGTWLRAAIDLRPSDVQLDALQHGVPLTLQLSVRGADAAAAKVALTLRYFPLSRRYQLRVEPGEHDRSFALRGYLFDALTRLRVPLPHDPCLDAAACRVQVRFDYAALPGALRLPALVQSAWRIAPASLTMGAP